jgi:hypothetical protein
MRRGALVPPVLIPQLTPRAGTGGTQDTVLYAVQAAVLARQPAASTTAVHLVGVLAGSLAAQLGREPAEMATSIASVPLRAASSIDCGQPRYKQLLLSI